MSEHKSYMDDLHWLYSRRHAILRRIQLTEEGLLPTYDQVARWRALEMIERRISELEVVRKS
jgi:hypothetical protein